MQNDKVRRKENETTYLDPEAQTRPALVPQATSLLASLVSSLLLRDSDPRVLSVWPLLWSSVPPHLPAGISRTTLTLSFLRTCLGLKVFLKQVIFSVSLSSAFLMTDDSRTD